MEMDEIRVMSQQRGRGALEAAAGTSTQLTRKTRGAPPARYPAQLQTLCLRTLAKHFPLYVSDGSIHLYDALRLLPVKMLRALLVYISRMENESCDTHRDNDNDNDNDNVTYSGRSWISAVRCLLQVLSREDERFVMSFPSKDCIQYRGRASSSVSRCEPVPMTPFFQSFLRDADTNACMQAGYTMGRLLSACTNLERLNADVACRNQQHSGFGALVREIATLPNLSYLKLKENFHGDASRNGLRTLINGIAGQNIIALDLSFSDAVDDEVMALLAAMPKLEWLDVAGCSHVTDQGLKHFAMRERRTGQTPLVRAIDVTRTKVSSRGIRQLQDNIPFCIVLTGFYDDKRRDSSCSRATHHHDKMRDKLDFPSDLNTRTRYVQASYGDRTVWSIVKRAVTEWNGLDDLRRRRPTRIKVKRKREC